MIIFNKTGSGRTSEKLTQTEEEHPRKPEHFRKRFIKPENLRFLLLCDRSAEQARPWVWCGAALHARVHHVAAAQRQLLLFQVRT
jgi:hypothetical protein